MKLKTVILLAVLLVHFGCKQGEHKKENSTPLKTNTGVAQKIPDHLTSWVTAVNSTNSSALDEAYDASAVLVVSADSIIRGSSEIADYYGTRKDQVTSIESLFRVEANKERRITYELVKYKIDSLEEYVQIVIWSTADEKIRRAFEFSAVKSIEAARIDTTDIVERRKLWVELCNTNKPENLVKELYSTNTMYFNHKPIVKGQENLIKEYGYMSDKNYNLRLHPTLLEVVNANFAFEIGQCSGSYNGKYILVWKKDAQGKWNIYIDSNI